MTQYNSLNVKLSISQLIKLKSGIKNGTEVTLNLSSNAIVHAFLHKLLLTDRYVLRFPKAFANNWSINIKLSKTQLSKMVQLGGSKPVLDLWELYKEQRWRFWYMKNEYYPKSKKDFIRFFVNRGIDKTN